MPGRKRPTDEDAVTARRVLLDGLSRDADIFEVLSRLEPLHPRNDTFPGEVFLRLAADALEWCGASRAEPLSLEGLQEQYLPECAFRGRQNSKLQYAVLVAAAIHGGTEPDLLEEVAYWQTDDFWQYAAYAAVAYIRAAANQADVLVPQVCQELDQGSGHPPLYRRLFSLPRNTSRIIEIRPDQPLRRRSPPASRPADYESVRRLSAATSLTSNDDQLASSVRVT